MALEHKRCPFQFHGISPQNAPYYRPCVKLCPHTTKHEQRRTTATSGPMPAASTLPPPSACVRQQREEFGSHDFWRSREFLSESWRAAQTAAAAPLPSAAGLPLPSMLLLMGKREYPPPSFLFDAMTEGGVRKTMRRRREKGGRGIVCRSFGSSINRRGARMRADAVLKQAIEKIGCCGVFRDFSQGTF